MFCSEVYWDPLFLAGEARSVVVFKEFSLVIFFFMMYLFILIIRYTQTFEGIPVFGGDIVMKFKGRTLKSTHGKVTNLARSRIGNVK